MNKKISSKRARCLDAIAAGLPERASTLTRLFFVTSKTGITRTEGTLLHALSERPHRITELALRVGISQPAVTQLANRLETRGWVTRAVDRTDRRAVIVRLTASGRAAANRMHHEYRALMRTNMAELEEEDLETLRRALEILDQVIERLGADPIARPTPTVPAAASD